MLTTFAIILVAITPSNIWKESVMGKPQAEWHLKDAKIVTTDEFRTILGRAKELGEYDPWWALMYDWTAIAVNSGLRVSEVAHIEKGDVLPHRLMVIRRKKRHLHPEPIEIMPAVREILHRRADAVEDGYIFPGKQAPCFINRRNGTREQVCVGGHASIRNVQRRWRLLLEDLGLYKLGRGIHSARHTAVTEIYRATKDLRKAQVFAGHSSSSITEVYAHVTDMKETLEGMEATV